MIYKYVIFKHIHFNIIDNITLLIVNNKCDIK